MKLTDQLLKEHSRKNCDVVVAWVGKNQSRFDELFGLFLHGSPRVSQMAAWPMRYAVENFPALMEKHFDSLVDNLERNQLHDAITRNTYNILEAIEIPEALHGRVMNMCFEYVCNPASKAAPKASCLTILHKFTKVYPEIMQELKTIITDRWEHEGAAFRSRAKKITKLS